MAMERENDDFAVFKQHVFKRLAFLGMQQGDSTKFVDLSVKLVSSGIEGKVARGEVKKLVASLARVLGKPRADLFVKWLVEKIPQVSSSAPVLTDAKAPESKPKSAAEGARQKDKENARPAQQLDKENARPLQQSNAKLISESACDKVAATMGSAALSQRPAAERPTGSKCKCNSSEAEGSLPAQLGGVVNKLCDASTEMVIDEAWVEVTSKFGKTYFWNRTTNSVAWALPSGIGAKWISQKSVEGRTFYYDRSGNALWVMPPLKSSSASEGGRKEQVALTKAADSSALIVAAAKLEPTSCSQAASSPKRSGSTDEKCVRVRSRSSRRRLSSDAKQKLAEKIAALKQISKPEDVASESKTANRPLLEKNSEEKTVFEFQQNRRAFIGGA